MIWESLWELFATGRLEAMRSKLENIHPLIWIGVLASSIRLINLNQSLWLDEAAQALESARPLTQQFDIVGDFQPPLLHLIVHLFYQISSTDWFLRLPSVIAGVVAIIYTYKITNHLFGKRAAFIAGLIGATSPYHYYFSQELRQYSLPTAFATMSMWYFITWLKSKSKKLSWGYVLSSAAGMYSMYVFPFLLLSQLIYVLTHFKKRLFSFIKHLFIVGLIFAPWIPMFLKQLQAGVGLRDSFVGWATAVSLPMNKALPLTAIRFLIGMIPVDFTFWQVALFVGVGLGLSWIVKDAFVQKKSSSIIWWLFMPVLLAFGFSFLIPILEPKRVMFVLPALWAIVAAGVVNKKKWLTIAALILTIQAGLLVVHFTNPKLQREDWKSAVSFVENHQSKDKAAVFAFPDPFGPWDWYESNTVPSYATQILSVPNISYLDGVIGKSLDHDTIFVFEYLMDLSDPQRYIFTWLESHNYSNVQIKDFHGVGFIHIYQRYVPLAVN